MEPAIAHDESQETRLDARLIATIAHELRTPISSLRVAFDLINDESSKRAMQANPQQYRRLMYNMGRSLDKIERQVADLLDIGYLQSQNLTLQYSSVRPTELIATAIEQTSQLASGRDQTVDVDLSADVPDFQGDEERLAQVLVNLLSHSIRTAPVGSTISLTVSPESDTVAFAIADTGRTVPEEDRERLFKPFYRLLDDESEVADTGLGLAIARSLVDLHRGRVWLDSPTGQGNVFHITLPVSNADESPRS